MAKLARTKVEDARKPKHSNDAERPSKGGKNLRDAATVRATSHPAHACPIDHRQTLGSCFFLPFVDAHPPTA
jgi:hypothetical protein